MMTTRITLLSAFFLSSLSGMATAQDLPAPAPSNTVETDAVFVPQLRNARLPVMDPNSQKQVQNLPTNPTAGEGEPAFGRLAVVVPQVTALVKIHNTRAETELKFSCQNIGQETLQAPIVVPLPTNAQDLKTTPGVDQKNNPVPGGQSALVSAEDALPVWQNLAKQLADPAPLEFCGHPLLKSSPVYLPPGESQSVIMQYGMTCPTDAGRVDYVLPRSESVQYAVPWSVAVDVRCDQPIATVYSPSHKLETKRLSANSLQVKMDEADANQPGGFWLSYLIDQGGLSATLFTQPDDTTPEADGTFLFLAGVPALPKDGKGIPRELTLALDRSSSMQGKKLEQVRAAATQVLKSLDDGESFNIITYNDKITTFAEKPVKKTTETFDAACKFIEAVEPRGGTNLHRALEESIKQQPTPRTLPIVLFFTDGLPTVGETSELTIREVIAKQNPHGQRIFTVGVGVDVNTVLLDSIAKSSRAQPTFVLSTENIKAKVSEVFQSLESPVLADAVLTIQSKANQTDAKRVRDVFPNPLPDLFQDDHMVVLGRYHGTEPLTFEVTGNYLGNEKTFAFTFPLQDQPAYPFVSRLWATQKIAALVEEIRKSGANADPYDILINPKQDPKLKSQAEEVLKLTTRYGILTEYTAFLAKDGELNPSQQLDMAYRNFDERAVKTRVGLSSVNQSVNNTALQREYSLNRGNYYWNANMEREAVPNVQQLGNGAFFLRGNTWVDGRLIGDPNIAPDNVITFGTREHQKLLDRLVENGEHAPLSLGGNVLMEIDKKPVLIRGAEPTASPTVGKGIPAKE